MSKKKILVTATTFPRWKDDSTPRFVYDLARSLANKFNITVLAPHHPGALKREKIGNMQIRRFAYFKPERLQRLCYSGGIIPNMRQSFLAKLQMPLLIASEFLASYRIIRQNQIEMVHAHWILPQGLVGVFLKKISKVKLLVTIHGSDLFPLKSGFFKNLQKFVLKNSDVVTVNSKATKHELVKRFPEYSSIVTIIPMGVDINLFRKRKATKPKKYKKNKLILFVGRLSDQKGLQYLIEAMLETIKSEPKARLLVIGEGPYKKFLEEITDKKGLRNYVDFLGSKSPIEISIFYNFSDVFVMPSLSTKTGTEALGITLLEAMASGCAVVGTKVGGIRYIINDRANGLLVNERNSKDLSDKIVILLKNKKIAINFGIKASELVRKNYSWKKISKDFVEVYDEALK